MKTKFLKTILFTIIAGCFFSFSPVKAQNLDLSGRIWFFSDSCGIDFRDTNNVIPYFGNTFTNQSPSSAISSPDGQLVFYSDNRRIKDRHHQYILGRDSIGFNSGEFSKCFFFRGTTDTTVYHFISKINSGSSYLTVEKIKNPPGSRTIGAPLADILIKPAAIPHP